VQVIKKGYSLLLALSVAAVLAGGCGGGGSSTVAGGSGNDASGRPPERLFGGEGKDPEREEATRVLRAWMKAREAHHWGEVCSYFSQRYSKILTEDAHGSSGGKAKTCAQALAYFGHNAMGSYANTLVGSVTRLRVSGQDGYAEYHGPKGKDYYLPMRKEGSHWTVDNAAVFPQE
jgi:hypothetical protein